MKYFDFYGFGQLWRQIGHILMYLLSKSSISVKLPVILLLPVIYRFSITGNYRYTDLPNPTPSHNILGNMG